MKFIFVTPKWTNTLGRFDFLAKLMVVHYPLNVAILARYVENAGHQVKFIDAQVEELSNEQVAAMIVQERADAVGYSMTSPLYEPSVQIARGVRAIMPSTVHIGGGAHINALGKKAYNDVFDYLVYGEAERTIVELLEFIEGKPSGGRETIQGIIYKDAQDIVTQTAPRPVIDDLNSIDFQAAHLMNLPKYTVCEGINKGSQNYISMVASRGCPYQCVFCAEPLNGRKLRFRSPENIVAEMEAHYLNLGVKHFFFVDSSLTLKRRQIMRVAEILIEKKLPITWSGWTRVDLVDEELLTKMKEAGFMAISLGIESGDPEVLKISKKNINLTKVNRAFEILRKLDIEAFCSAMIGLPGETKASAWRTVNFIRNTPGVLYSTLSMATPYPGTEMERWLIEGKHGMKLLDSGGVKSGSRWDDCSFSVNDLTPKDLMRIQRLGLIWIHLTPKRVFFILKMLGLKNSLKVMLAVTGVYKALDAISGLVRKKGSSVEKESLG